MKEKFLTQINLENSEKDAQYNNKIGLQSNYLSSNNNDAKSSEAKNFTSNLMNDNLPKMNSTESINNSISLYFILLHSSLLYSLQGKFLLTKKLSQS